MTPRIRQLDLSAAPEAVFAAAADDCPLCAIWSGADDRRSRWIILAHPTSSASSSGAALAITPNPRWPAGDTPTAPVPFTGGWIGLLAYDAGAEFEPYAPTIRHPDWPAAAWLRCDDALVYDRAERRWWAVGSPQVPGDDRLNAAPPAPAPFRLGPVSPTLGPDEYTTQVRRALDHIAGGDIYQINLTHELSAPFSGSPRGLFLALAARAKPWYGGYLELPGGRAVCSASPELFLQVRPDGRVVTRPMKGTRSGAGLADELRESEKERAELHMIVDLLRNDLGRVCAPGSIAVDQLRAIETHAPAPEAALLQATATISGRLRSGTGLHDVLRATFPGGSITGAPKVRAMQLVAELEQRPRGPYCGAIGWVSDSGHAAFNIAIRTALVHDGRLSYSVGAGIVADSDPEAEWRETLDKARVLLDIAVPHEGVFIPAGLHRPAAARR